MTNESGFGPRERAWVAAIHRTEDDYTPIGSAVVIDARRVLTCAHVVRDRDTIKSPLWVAFPMAEGDTTTRRRVAAVNLATTAADKVADIAVLRLEADVPSWVLPAPLRSPRGTDVIGLRWWAHGFAGGDPLGYSAQGNVREALPYGWIHLQSDSSYIVDVGFSGGGLWSPDYNAVIGLIGQANDRGDARAITLFQADHWLPEEKLLALATWSVEQADEVALAAWGWKLESDPEAGRHWRPRARGVTRESERGYRFQGRAIALKAVTDWLDRELIDRQALVVTGSPGVGKSAVLGRIVTTADASVQAELPLDDKAVKASLGSVACAVHAKGKTALEVATEIARAASAPLPQQTQDLATLIRQVLAEPRGRRFNVVIDALDEATSPEEARAIITDIVLPLVEDCSDVGAQVLVGTRRRDDKGDLLREFTRRAKIIDLDHQEFFALADLRAYALATLQLNGDERYGNPYQDEDAAHPVADRIATLSQGNFLIAGLIARTHGLHDQTAIAPHHISFSPTVDSALRSYLSRLSPVAGVTAESALTALAFAEAPGLTAELWKVTLAALGEENVSASELARFARSSAANFLVESSSDGPTAVFRLFHQALNDSLLNTRAQIIPRADDEYRLTASYLAEGARTDWKNAPAYLLRSLPAHAARAQDFDSVLLEDNFLLYADLQRILPLADLARSTQGQARARLLQLTPQGVAANASVRGAMFTVNEALEDLGTSFRRSTQVMPYRAEWASAGPRVERMVMEGHTGRVAAVSTFIVDGRILLATAGDDKTIRVWDPTTGQNQHTLNGHTSPVNAICTFTVDGRILLATAGDDKTIRVWDATTGQNQNVLPCHASRVNAICSLTIEGRTLLATAGDERTVRIWDPATGAQVNRLIGHTGWVKSIGAYTVDGHTFLATVSNDWTVRVWNVGTGKCVNTLFLRRSGRVGAFCAFTVDGRYLLSTSNDRTIRIWDPATGENQQTLTGHNAPVNAICSLTIEGRTLLATTGDDRTVRIWDPVTGENQQTLTGHNAPVNAICSLTIEGRTLLATTGDDRTVRIWDPTTNQVQSNEVLRRADSVRTVCAFNSEGHAFFATSNNYSPIRILDAETGHEQRALAGRTSNVTDIHAFSLYDRTFLVTGSKDGDVDLWDAATGQRQTTISSHTGKINAICTSMIEGHLLLAIATNDLTVRTWPIAVSKHEFGHPSDETDHLPWARTVRETSWRIYHDPTHGDLFLDHHFARIYNNRRFTRPNRTGRLARFANDRVRAMCAFALNGEILLAATGHDRTIRILDVTTSRRKNALTGHTGNVNDVCTFTLGDRAFLASVSNDRTLRIWDPATGQHRSLLNAHAGDANAICALILDGRPFLATTSSDRTVRIWDPATLDCLCVIPVHHEGLAIEWDGERLAVVLSAGMLVIRLSPTLVRS
ncbi:hypothetical protein Psi02_63820 [Planotetraspora silvatica]|uniref:Uncharacterized protein n=1 Tax=Planotetraspora silvatica TaxID=234614 RepID=A0A8J3URE8_9ACTN|nr:trypsin-like peptidase domain-containing protein [Planotetraspora silvatica]GII49958.1 hypothetical protein Psi02_63820 [Planotetraspora silvatica]